MRAGPDVRMLFIGNSYTARNDLPGRIARLAAPAAHVTTELINAGGASLRRHWNAGRATAAIARGGWRYVVLQEQSTLPLKNRARYHDNVRLFDAPIKESGARAVLYLTWARASVPELQDALNDAVLTIAQEIGALVVPVGIAWSRVLREHPEIALFEPDGSHPTRAGTYLAACVFAGTLFGDATFDAQASEEVPHAAVLRGVARATVAQHVLR